MPGSIENATPGMSRRSSRVSKLSMCGPEPCSWIASIECPVRWVKYWPNPRAVITPRAASSTSAPRIGSPPNARAHDRDRRVACVAHRFPYSDCARARRADGTHPRLVGEDAAALPGPEVHQHQLARPDGARPAGRRRIVWIGRVRPGRHDGRMVELQVGALELLDDPALQLVLRDRLSGADAAAGFG